MAGRLFLPEVDLTCPVCCEIFRDPVVLKCSHSFCASCLQQYWNQQRRNRDCPLCRTQSLDDPVPSLTLKNLCESCTHESEEPEEAVEELYGEPGELCPHHGEKLKLYCLLDKEPICVVCHTSRKHKQHECCPVSEALVDVKEKMKSALTALKQRTREEFEKLHNFLHAEENARMEALKREEEQKTEQMKQKVEEMERKIASVSESIRVLEEEMASEGITVLHVSFNDCPVEDPVMPPGALIDVAKYVGSLMFHVWEKMHKIAKYTPVTLDPNTAAPWLILSDDLTTVCDSDEKQKLPDNPERFDPDTGVLGSEGFTSGRRAWDVNVGDNTAWVVGVAKESVQRKEKVSSVLKNGYLCVYFYHKMYFAGTSPLTRLNLKRNPQKIRVQLDCDKGKVSFYDPHNNALIYSFKQAITEKVFPYFWVGCQQCPLTVEPVEVLLSVAESAT
uniref:Tripartite motif containing 35-14 n=1 Tax=Amphilophus citrinellus TaxID=61819 RepID=A0A3Q0R0K6_AMPCI